MANERLFEVALGVLVPEGEELQDEGVLDLLLGQNNVFWTGPPPLPFDQHGGPVLGQSGALVELGTYLPV